MPSPGDSKKKKPSPPPAKPAKAKRLPSDSEHEAAPSRRGGKSASSEE